MTRSRGALLILIVIALSGCDRGQPVVVQTPLGAVAGKQVQGVQKFLGLPYAEPPTGPLRWRAPVPVAPWTGTLSADEYGPWCPQFDFDRRDEGEVFSGEGWTIFRHVPPNEASAENCLSLNVFAPSPDGHQKPVMVFLPGNGLGSSYPVYDGTAFARSGVVFVSINYRLHSMGIFAHPALTEEAKPGERLGRYSEMDRLAALRWVKQNIASFGGDPNRVTVAGSSEGGAAILQMLGNPSATGLFEQAIVQSGNGWWSPMSFGDHEQLGCYLAELSGLDGCDASAEALRSLSWSTMPATGPYTLDNRSDNVGATAAIESGDVMDVPLLIGWNDFDGSSLRYAFDQVISGTHPDVLTTYDATQTDEDLAYEIYTDLHSGAPARWVAHRLEGGAPVYLYLFSYVVSWDREASRGGEHGYELPHVFDSFEAALDDTFPFLSQVLLSDDERAMTDIMHACWVSFVTHGRPVCPNAPVWPRYERATDQLMELNLAPKVRSGFRAPQLDAHERHRAHYFDKVEAGYRKLLDEGL